MPPCTEAEFGAFQTRHAIGDGPNIGISARLATEKGVEVLLNALPRVLEAFPNARVLHAGPYENIIGEEAYFARLQPLFERYRDHYTLLGTLHGADLTAFYRSLDALVVSSLNSTESFGLVQIEAMRRGMLPEALPNGPVLDGWERPVLYERDGETYTLVSLGSDGERGGTGHAADVEVSGP